MVDIKPHPKKKNSGTFTDKLVTLFFNKPEIVILLLILILGIVLRYYAAIGVEPNADEMVHGPHSTGIIASGVIGRVWESILWSYLTDFFQIFLGVSLFSMRFLSFLFGSATPLLVYLVGKEVFDKKVGLIAAFLIAISTYHIGFTMAEMDIAAVFFILLATLFFIKKLKKSGEISYIAAIIIGIAGLIKTLSLFFVPAFIIGYWIYKKKVFDKKVFISTLKFGLVIILVFSPILIHNWLFYQDKNLVDAYFSQYFDVGNSRQAYSGIQGINHGFKFNEVVEGSYSNFISYLKFDPVNMILGCLGLIFLIYKKKNWSIFFFMFQLIPFLLITVTNRLSTHYAVLPPIFALYGAALLDLGVSKFKGDFSYKKIMSVLLVILFAVNIYLIFPSIRHESPLEQMRSYTIENIRSSDVVIADARIYRGRIMGMFIDKHYLESSYLPDILNYNQQLGGAQETYNMYFVECIPDDCGWGTIKDQPDFNSSTENLVSAFKQQASLQKTISGGIDNQPYFNIYLTEVNLNPQILSTIDSTHEFFYYPAMYKPKSKIFDYYNVNGFTNIFLFNLARFIIWTSFIIALLSIPYIFYLIFREK